MASNHVSSFRRLVSQRVLFNHCRCRRIKLVDEGLHAHIVACRRGEDGDQGSASVWFGIDASVQFSITWQASRSASGLKD